MLDWMILPLKRYAQFSGRSRRREFWSFALLNLIVIAVLMAVMFGSGASFERLAENRPGFTLASYSMFYSGSGILVSLWWLAVVIPSVAVTVRRLHDRDLSGWWYLGAIVIGVIPLIGFLASLALFVVLLLPGTRGANRFGADPKDPASLDVFA